MTDILFENEFYAVSKSKAVQYNIYNKVTNVLEATESKFPTAVGMAKGLEAATKRLMNDNKDTGVRK
ncbi:MAG: hypothetical protein ACRC6R_06050 [Bacteroidales bacterium]